MRRRAAVRRRWCTVKAPHPSLPQELRALADQFYALIFDPEGTPRHPRILEKLKAMAPQVCERLKRHAEVRQAAGRLDPKGYRIRANAWRRTKELTTDVALLLGLVEFSFAERYTRDEHETGTANLLDELPKELRDQLAGVILAELLAEEDLLNGLLDLRGAFERVKERYETQTDTKLPDEAATTADSEAIRNLKGEERALALLVSHPEWTNTEVAKAVPCNRTTLYKWKNYRKARKALEQSRQSMPGGSKDAETGHIEAWDRQ